MNEGRYIISDAARKLKVEPHVLRYWEEELHLDIPRNEMGHRQYTQESMQLLKQIKDLKEKGFQLKAIKLAIPKIEQICELDEVSLYRIREELNQKVEEKTNCLTVLKTEEPKVFVDNAPKMQQFKMIMKDLIMEALKENNEELSDAVSDNISDNVLKEMDYMIREKEEREEDRFRRLDESIRGMQKARQEVAAAQLEVTKKKKEGIFRKKK
ncbi:MAG: helix-turn-helix domain-containing protein [Velocimicrobium sp.]